MPPVIHRTYQSPLLAPGPVYLDSSILVAFTTTHDRYYPRAVQFVGDHQVARVELQISVLGLDEALWRLARGMVARSRNIPIRQLDLGKLVKRGPSVLAPHLPQLRQAVTFMQTWATLVAPSSSPSQFVDSWLDRLSDIGGLHDAQHLALAEHTGARSFATTDRDYQQLTTLPFALMVYRL